jgi:hypothetical protein
MNPFVIIPVIFVTIAMSPISTNILGIFLTVFCCCACITVLLMLFLWSVYLAAEDGFKQLSKLHQIPCDRCIYHTGNYHLKCTVRPCDAFTETAIHCRDFEPLHQPNLTQTFGAEVCAKFTQQVKENAKTAI